MTMRLSNQMVAHATLTDLQGVANQLRDTQRKMSSGKEITRPSDDPFGTTKALTTRRDVEDITQLQSNVDDALSWQSVTETALSGINDVAQRARELLVQGGSDSNGPTEREAIAKEIDQLIETAKGEANASVGGRFVFAGTATTTQPYNPGGSDAYAGDSGNVVRTIGPGVSLPVNVRGSDFLGGDPAVAQPDGKLLTTLRDIATHLRGGTPADANALRNGDLVALDRNLDTLSSTRATIGAQTNRLDSAKSRLLELEGNSRSQLSDVEDADMAKVLTDFSLQQSVYQSALKAGANIVQASLLDFIH
ncbi:MAG: flagellar hook-associated protein 3 FlgL [Thermoleophilaceae bacterium]|jgi:flagellar hook-associated protein 3 FlgL|nr:flagellar hook-associated protein 3 FlgL [Thermoleophilaceae bacterium]